MTNAAVVSGSKHGVGGYHNATIRGNGLAAASKFAEDGSAAAAGGVSSRGSGNGSSVTGDQLDTNSVSRLRSSDSFRYVSRSMNCAVIANLIVNNNWLVIQIKGRTVC